MSDDKPSVVFRMRQYLNGLTRQQKRHDWQEVNRLMNDAIRDIELQQLLHESELAQLRAAIKAIADNKIDIELMHGDKPFYAIRWKGHCHCSYNGFETALKDLINALKEVK